MADKCNKIIKLYVTEEEEKVIRDAIKGTDITISKYIKSLVTQDGVDELLRKSIVIEVDDLLEHTNQIGELRKSLNQVILTTIQTKEVYEADIRKIMNIMLNIEQIEKELLENINTKRNRILVEAKKIAKEYINGNGGKIHGNNKNSCYSEHPE